ncbi:DUF6350 family protein [Jiangella sp. DSM 45060]|uniref:cell division protein PerM n=1 Tax=Jiangella sp. DSM 45060 TaxID=1798224 RepID=UPI00087AB239|nr:DUF6350 family protein [Jiangella sp. DSM 45060]SDT60231.1 hypothetical protein SAMN04515669_5044 [Jiangella sp. DSM 45060]
MADLLTRPLLRRDEPAWGSRVPWLAAIVATAWALLAGFALCVLPGVAVWIAEGAVGPLGDPLRFASQAWLTAHHAGLDVGGGSFTLAPLGLTLLFVLLLHRSARWAAHSAGVATTRGAVAVVVPAVVTYIVGAGIVAALSTSHDVAGDPFEAVLWAALWSGAAVATGVAHESGLLADWWWRVPPLMRAALAGAGVAVAGLVGVGAALMGVSLVAHTGRIGDLATALDAGPLGATLLIVGCALLVPNLVVWSAAFALGPGFAVGTATSVAPDGVTLGLVPAVPVFGALPTDLPGSLTWLVVAGPVLAGLLAGLMVHRRLGRVPDLGLGSEADGDVGEDGDGDGDGVALGPALGVAAGAGAIAAVAMAVLALLSGGSAGAERLTALGPVPWEVAAATFGLVTVPALVVVLVLRFRRRPADAADEADGNEADDTERTRDGAAHAADADPADRAVDTAEGEPVSVREEDPPPPPPEQ